MGRLCGGPEGTEASGAVTLRAGRRPWLLLLAALVAIGVVLVLVLPTGPAVKKHRRHRRHHHHVLAIHWPPTLPSGVDWTGGGIPEPRFLSPTSVWNAPLPTDAPLDPSSNAIVSNLVSLAQDNGAALDVKAFSTPIYIVGADQPRVYMHLTANPDTGRVNPQLQAAFSSVPVPADAVPAAGHDELMVVYQPSTDTMWESWHTRREADGWHFDYGGRIVDASQNPGYYQQILSGRTALEEPWWGPSATSLPLADSVISFRDLRDGYIDHALALDVPHFAVRKDAVAWPAERGDGVSLAGNSIPEGAHFRLDPSLNIASLHLPPLTAMIAEAAQKYGFIVRDGSSDITVDGQAPRTPAQVAAWKAVLNGSGFGFYSQVLKDFPWSHLQLLRMSLRPLVDGDVAAIRIAQRR